MVSNENDFVLYSFLFLQLKNSIQNRRFVLTIGKKDRLNRWFLWVEEQSVSLFLFEILEL